MTERNRAEELGLSVPRAIVTLKVADEGDRTIWVTESLDEVEARVSGHAAEQVRGRGGSPLIRLSRVKAMKAEPFFTRFDNVANIEGIGE